MNKSDAVENLIAEVNASMKELDKSVPCHCEESYDYGYRYQSTCEFHRIAGNLCAAISRVREYRRESA